MKILPLFLAVWLAALGSLRAEEAAPSPALDFVIFPSIQYAHTDIWFHTPSNAEPSLAVVKDDEIAPGQRLDLLVVVRGYRVDAEGRAHVTYDLAIHYPNGKTQTLPDPVIVIDRAKIDPRALLFPQRIVSFNTNPGDLAGEYRFEITVHDHVAGTTATKSASVRVSDTNAPLALPANYDPVSLLGDYYQRPRPRLALPTLTALSHTPLAQKKIDLLGVLLGFYEQVLADNPWLLPQFKDRFAATTDEGERRLFALVLAYARRDQPTFGDDLPPPARTALIAARAEPLPVPSSEPMKGGQLDALWGCFFASGRFEPITRLVTIAQNYLPYRGQLEKFKQLTVKPQTPAPEIYKDAILGSALWSLGSNAQQHKLVHDYLLGLQQSKETSPEMKMVLQAALDWKPRPPGPTAPRL